MAVSATGAATISATGSKLPGLIRWTRGQANHILKAMKKPDVIILASACAIAPLAAGVLYLQPGTAGLLSWMPEYRPPLVLGALSPLVPLALHALSRRLPRRLDRFRAPLRLASLALAALLSLAVLSGGALYARLCSGYDPALASALPAIRLSTAETRSLDARHPAAPSESASRPGVVPLARLAFSSDPHVGSPRSNPGVTSGILDAAIRLDHSVFFLIGDIAEMGFPGTGFEDAARLIARSLGAGSGSGDAGMRLVTLMGNHDSVVAGARRYRAYFNPARYFHLKIANAHVIALDLLWGSESFDRAQRAWLERTLDSIPPGERVIVTSHCFMRSSGYVNRETGKDWFDHAGTLRDVAPTLEARGVDLVITGHNHYLEYLVSPVSAAGTRTAYAVVGGMGGHLDPGPEYVSPESVWRGAGSHGFATVELFSDGIEIAFRDETGRELARFSPGN